MAMILAVQLKSRVPSVVLLLEFLFNLKVISRSIALIASAPVRLMAKTIKKTILTSLKPQALSIPIEFKIDFCYVAVKSWILF
jgi:hypothetical protein